MTTKEDIYRPLTLRTLMNYQIQYLARKFELSRESRVSELLVKRINAAIETAEAEVGIRRVMPFELYLQRKRKGMALPLFKPEYLEPIFKGETFRQSRQLLEKECLKRLRKCCPKATMNELLRVVYPWTLIRGNGPLSFAETLLSEPREGETKRQHDMLKTLKPPLPSQRMETPDLSAPEPVVQKLTGMVNTEGGFGRTVARRLVEEVITLRNLSCPRMDTLKSGQVPLLVTHVRAHLSEELATKYRRLAPIIVTLWDKDELTEELPQIVPAFVKQLERRIIRVCFEAYRQNGLLTLMDMQWLFQMSASRISEIIRAYQKKHKIVVPTPGTVLDAGRSMTHKDIIVRLHLEGYNVKEIAQKTYHSPRAVDSYIGTFESVLILKLFKVPIELISRLLNKGITLIREHISLIDELYTTEQDIKEYLLEKGVKI